MDETDMDWDVVQKNMCENCELSGDRPVSTNSSRPPKADISQREFICGMKEKVLDIRKQLGGLNDTVKDMTSTKFNAGIYKNGDIKEQNIEVITNYIAFIRTQFNSLKIEGQMSFESLQMFESELRRDITALKNTSTQESLSNISEKENSKEAYKNISEDCNMEQNLTKNNFLSVNSAVFSVPLFYHEWDERDHVVFVRIYNKYLKNYKILEECEHVLPYRSKEDISSHLISYSKYLENKEKSREMIRIWKENKEIEKRETIKKIEEEKNILEEEEQKKKEKLRVKINKEKALQSQKLKEWKKNKHKDEYVRKVKEVDNHSFSHDTLPEKNKTTCQSYTDKEREEIALRLKMYKEEKSKEMEEKSTCQRNIQTLNNRKEKLLQLWKRDQEYIVAKRQQKELKDKITEDKQVQMNKLRSKVNSKVPSDRSRILQTTASHEAFKRTKQKSSQCFSIDHTEKRAVPEWRQDL